MKPLTLRDLHFNDLRGTAATKFSLLHRELLQARISDLKSHIDKGGLQECVIGGLLYVGLARGTKPTCRSDNYIGEHGKALKFLKQHFPLAGMMTSVTGTSRRYARLSGRATPSLMGLNCSALGPPDKIFQKPFPNVSYITHLDCHFNYFYRAWQRASG